MTPHLESPIVILQNIRRWALEGLRDEPLVSRLTHLQSPELLGASTKACRTITAKQARMVLANAFLGNCTDVMEQYKDRQGGLNFNNLFREYSRVGPAKAECLLIYFQACATLEGTDDDARKIIFERIRFTPLQVDASFVMLAAERFVGQGVNIHSGPMESPSASGFCNFANSNFGYGRVIDSCTQEQILEVCCPEFMIGMLFIGKMQDDEVVNVQGVRRFATYSGYLNSFCCTGPINDNNASNIQTILTMDACSQRHFSETNLVRDSSKAYYSFQEHARNSVAGQFPVVSTGKWGCGIFGGVPAHKMVQQVLAANLAGVDLEFSCFGSYDECDKVLAAMYTNKPTAVQVMQLLRVCTNRGSFAKDAVRYLRSLPKDTQQQKVVTKAVFLGVLILRLMLAFFFGK
jgi:poly(ADP-ribose) glycohydrolase